MTCLVVSSGVLSSIAVILFIIGWIGHVADSTYTETIPWGLCKADFGFVKVDGYLGTSKYIIDAPELDLKIKESYVKCGDEWCQTCEDTGTATLGLTIVALGFALVSIGFNKCQMHSDDLSLIIGASVCCLVSAAAAAIAFAVFRDCFSDFVDEFGQVGSVKGTYGVNGWLVISGAACVFLSAVLNMFSFCCFRAKPQEPASQTTENTAL